MRIVDATGADGLSCDVGPAAPLRADLGAERAIDSMKILLATSAPSPCVFELYRATASVLPDVDASEWVRVGRTIGIDGSSASMCEALFEPIVARFVKLALCDSGEGGGAVTVRELDFPSVATLDPELTPTRRIVESCATYDDLRRELCADRATLDACRDALRLVHAKGVAVGVGLEALADQSELIVERLSTFHERVCVLERNLAHLVEEMRVEAARAGPLGGVFGPSAETP